MMGGVVLSATCGVIFLMYALRTKRPPSRKRLHHYGQQPPQQVGTKKVNPKESSSTPSASVVVKAPSGGEDECASLPSTAASSQWSGHTTAYSGHTVHIVEDTVVWPNGDHSEIKLHRADSWCKTDGRKLYWPNDSWSYIGENSLDGIWVTNSGHRLLIAGNLVTWQSGERSWLTMENCSEMSVKVLGKTFRAFRSGAQLHWDDGDTWTYSEDQELPVAVVFEQLRTGTLLRLARLDGLAKEEAMRHKALLGKSVVVLAKTRASGNDDVCSEGIAMCLAPDGCTTLQLPVSCLAMLPSTPPPVLQARGCDAFAGDYQLSTQTSPAGMPTWRHVTSDLWLYTSSEGRWCFGTADEKARAASVGPEVVSRDQHWGLMPHQLERGWSFSAAAQQAGRSAIGFDVFSVLRRSDGDALAKIIKALPQGLSTQVNVHVWKGWGRAVSLDDCGTLWDQPVDLDDCGTHQPVDLDDCGTLWDQPADLDDCGTLRDKPVDLDDCGTLWDQPPSDSEEEGEEADMDFSCEPVVAAAPSTWKPAGASRGVPAAGSVFACRM